MPDMTRHRSFTTASARRKADPVVWEVDQTTIRLRPSVDLVDVAELIDYVQSEQGGASFMQYAVEKRSKLAEMIGNFVIADDLPAYEAIKNDLDIGTIVEMVQDLIAEYAGTKNPTQPSLSSTGSEQTGETSTVGAPLVESTPAASPQTEQ